MTEAERESLRAILVSDDLAALRAWIDAHLLAALRVDPELRAALRADEDALLYGTPAPAALP